MNNRILLAIVIAIVLSAYYFCVFECEVNQAVEPVSSIEKEVGIETTTLNSVDFVSQIQEPWSFAGKKVYQDFLDHNALQSDDFKTDTLFDAQVIRIYEYDDIDYVISKLNKYEKLEAISFVKCDIDDQQFEKIIDVLISKIHFRKLMISRSRIRNIPDNISLLQGLETFDIKESNLIRINDEIIKLGHLKYLGLSKNRSLQSLPEDIGELKDLEMLNISSCSIDTIPTSIGECLKLRSLIANAGTVNHVPSSIGKCQSLTNLNLGYNNISFLPAEIGLLKNLELLIVGHNPYDSIPMSFKNLTKLYHFS